MQALDIHRIQGALDLLDDISIEGQLLQLKNLCENNGVWSIPENPNDYNPVLFEISLFGVSASAADIEELPTNWKRAANNILSGEKGRGMTSAPPRPAHEVITPELLRQLEITAKKERQLKELFHGADDPPAQPANKNQIERI